MGRRGLCVPAGGGCEGMRSDERLRVCLPRCSCRIGGADGSRLLLPQVWLTSSGHHKPWVGLLGSWDPGYYGMANVLRPWAGMTPVCSTRLPPDVIAGVVTLVTSSCNPHSRCLHAWPIPTQESGHTGIRGRGSFLTFLQ